ncbi:hypothetical protein CPC735_065630 [Coccidioides posadasii C735 delta SOWgp]|uniref:INO80 complex subunit F domain-containing protein n=1 Tax=Coccidioides posadasii (strain C735) TaxID=222929 RepID=C5PBY6_COCP7|nr:hypothetical protein CPC735_065630 [Coccidioides posadasii C735 delta SOWgp]EER25463.1 hypothetical protein CPC735_065630 [Coccidioides posadasii C735 delta SOWgp]|eukprot:XP_003067608.1 hypothetical protein CPC735_065630 [Coccidioides posadasii C735 delta SOWgp]
MEANEPNPLSQPPTNPSNAPAPPPNPPSIESAYKQKCIDLKKRLQEIESHNEALRARNERGHRYLQKMRLESCILLERLGLLTGMTDENGPGPEIRARALALMNQATSLLDDHEEGSADRPSGPRRVPDEEDYLDDESVGSAEDRPPTPEERPVRTKRNRKTEDHAKSHGAGENNADSVSSSLPTLMPAPVPHTPATGYNQPGLSSQNPFTPIAPNSVASAPLDVHRSAGVATSPIQSASDSRNQHMGNSFTPVASAQEQQHRYVSAFEDFTNRNRDKIASVLYRSRRSQLSDEDIDRAVIEHWEDLDPEEKREYGDRLGKRGAI